ncbi:MAG: hypothetical protein JWM36_4364 [Hyphomicrobiales bacterium]|nr:hypothetical protein [Hyphomicrobiales bacterium]
MKRETLPSRRTHELFRFEHGGISYTAGVGHFSDGRVAEIFIDCLKNTSDAAALARDAAVVLSLALQHGVAIASLRDAITRLQDGQPAGLVGRLLDILGEAT